MTRTKLISTAEGEIHVPFTAEEEAEANAREAEWVAGTARREALARITELEATITPRRLRDAVLTDEGRVWLEEVESAIALERAKL